MVKLKIGSFVPEGKVFLAPMAGVTDLPFRLICKEYKASLLYTEMINSKAVCYEDKNTFEMIKVEAEEQPVVVQIFGSEPEFMGESAKILTSLNRFAMIDINMGCPAPKVIKNGDGSALMKNPELAAEIVKSVKKNTNLPVTVKIRKGWDEKNVNAVSFASLMEKSGADAITVHGRTREQYYSGKADWDIIKEVKNSLNIPVIANGDIFTFDDAKNILSHTGADALMIGRGAQGNPFIFKEIYDYINEGSNVEKLSDAHKINTAINHYYLALKYKDEHKAVREMRKHVGWYLKGMKNSASFKEELNHLTNPEEVINKLRDYLESLT